MSHPISAVIRVGVRTALGIVSAALLVGIASCGSPSAASSPTSAGPTTTTTGANTTPNPTSTSSSTVIYQNALTLPSGAWANNVSDGCFFGSGGYHLAGAAYCFAPAGDLGDVDVTVHVKQIGGPTTSAFGIGVRIRYTPRLAFRYIVEGDGTWAFLKCNGEAACTMLVNRSANSAIHRGLDAVNTLELRAVGSHFDFFVNGTKVGQADDITNLEGGPVALIGSSGSEVVFSNLAIMAAS
jgi:hypothetical protein